MTPGQHVAMKILASATVCLLALAASVVHSPAQIAQQTTNGDGVGIFPNIMRQPGGAAVTNFGQVAPTMPGSANVALPGTAPVNEKVDDRVSPPKVSAPRLKSTEPGREPVLPFGENATDLTKPGVEPSGGTSDSSGDTIATTPAPSAGRPLSQTADLNIPISGTATVIGGDMLRVSGRVVVLHGADAPEAGQICFSGRSITWKCGDKAEETLRRLADGRYTTCLLKKSLGENAATAVCEVSGVGDVGAAMVRSGMAVVPRKFDSRYAGEEATARARSAGVWVGSFDMPWKVRRGAM